MQVHPVLHMSFPTAATPRPREMHADNDWQPMHEADDGHPAYKAECILDQRGDGPKLEYRTSWNGFLDSDAIWVPASQNDTCPALLRALHGVRTVLLADPFAHSA